MTGSSRWKITLAYDGGAYGGWQYQKPAGAPVLPSVQGEVAAALGKLLGGVEIAPPAMYAAGRTDAGVHALAQVAHVDIEKELTDTELRDGLNHFLPSTIRIKYAELVPADFHARHSAVSRAYRYRLVQSRSLRPDQRGYVGHVRLGHTYPLLNIKAMQAELEKVGFGAHDFTSLQDAECQSGTPICTVLNWQVFSHTDALGEDEVVLHIEADHFLHHMVRNLVSVLVKVGLGHLPAGELARLLALKNRVEAPGTFSAEGLYLYNIRYK
jgi:tRNA pseudouridine38-40 synthase